MKIIYLIGIIISLFLFLLLVLKRRKPKHEDILTWWIGTLAVHQILVYFHQTGQIYLYPHMLGVEFSLPLAQGVFHFFYVSEITRPGSLGLKKQAAHLLPMLMLILLAIPFYSLSGAEKISVYGRDGEGYAFYNLLRLFLIVGLGLGYAIYSLVLIRRHQRNVQQLYSNTEGKNLRWLQYLSVGLGGIWLLVIFSSDTVIFAGVAFLVLFIGFFGINQIPIFYSMEPVYVREEAEIPSPPIQDLPVRYAKSGLKEQDVDRIYAELRRIMEQEQLYLNSDLSLTELASRLDIHPNYLSQVINKQSQKNFYHYINTLRVEEFIRQASVPERRQRHTFLAIALECGFNSKSTFNKYFRQYTGKSPSQFFH
ncbi:MAG: helix-turn-helix domain-containing protein [Bacteroidota bacterium]